MSGQELLLGIAQIAVVVAGFTAVTAALTPPGGSWSPDQQIRQPAIVSTSCNVVFESLLPVIAFASVAAYAAALCLQLSVAVLSFYSVVAAASS